MDAAERKRQCDREYYHKNREYLSSKRNLDQKLKRQQKKLPPTRTPDLTPVKQQILVYHQGIPMIINV